MPNSNKAHITALPNTWRGLATVLKLLVHSEMKKQEQYSKLFTKLNLVNLEVRP